MDRMDSRKVAALHFTQYLCATHKISSNNTHIKREELKSIFSESYQPQFNIQCLEMKTLVPVLAKAGLLEKPSDNDNSNINFNWKCVEGLVSTDVYPEKPPTRLTKPVQRLIISQRYTLDHNHSERPDGVSNEKCMLCNVSLTPEIVDEHKRDELHLLRMSYRKRKNDFNETKHLMAVRFADQDSVNSSSSGPLQFVCRVGVKYQIVINFSNILDKTKIHLEKIISLMPNKDVAVEANKSFLLIPGEKYSMEVQAQFSSTGAVLYPLIFKLKLEGASTAKYHLADIAFITQSELMNELKATEPFRRSMGPVLKLHHAPVIPGKPLEDENSHELQYTSEFLRMTFQIPPTLINFLNHGFKEFPNMSPFQKETLNKLRSTLPTGDSQNALCPENYCQLLELLLFIEEHQMSKDIHYYDMHKITLKRMNGGLWLKVPGLVDKRPSLLINDTLHISFAGDNSVTYEGYVQRMDGSMVCLGLHNNFVNKYSHEKINVQFKINRGVLKSMHRSLYIIRRNGAEHLLFPSSKSKPVPQPPLRPWFNNSIKKNPEQQAAVRNIVHNSSEFAPYLVFGPPGTGKTMTLVEAILQLWDPIKRETRLLVCAPSNAAADEITSRLLQAIVTNNIMPLEKVKNHILRFCAMSRPLDTIPSNIQCAGITNHDRNTFQVRNPSLRAIMSYDIVISTVSNSSRFVLADMPPGHFTHIVIDEVGQALEPEALIPVAGLATYPGCEKFCSQVILAGDPKQLGPILQSPIAAKFGLDKSWLERLMSMPLYSKQPETNCYDPNVLTKLVLNYRSHPAILKVSNNLFYDDELQPVGDVHAIESACKWKGLEKEDFPVIFHGVEGLDEREGASPSFFNCQEIEIVIDYVQKVLKDQVATAKEIGVVTPYSMQVKKIRKALSLSKLPNIDVASVEQFQGQERKVIIISTVRSRPQFLDFDYMFQLGFLQNPKRFNVAVTRARSLLIIIGNPKVLKHDTCWRALLQHCMDNQSYKGLPFQLNSNVNEVS